MPDKKRSQPHQALIDQLIKSADAYWESWNFDEILSSQPEPDSVAGRVDDFIGYMIGWEDERDDPPTIKPESLRDLMISEGFMQVNTSKPVYWWTGA